MSYAMDQAKSAKAWDAALGAEKQAEAMLRDLDSIGELTEEFYNAGRDDEFHAAIADAINGNNTALTQMMYDAAIAKAA